MTEGKCKKKRASKGALFISAPPGKRGAGREYRVSVEVAGEESCEGFAVARLVASHLVHGVVDGVQTLFLGAFCEVEFALGRAVFGFHSLFEVDLGGGGDHFAYEFGEFGGVLGFLISRFSQ